MTDFYVGDHISQYGPPTQSATTHHDGCTWTATTNGIRTTSGGKKKPTPDQLHTRVKRSEESSPKTPGWSMPDAQLASSRYAKSAGMPGLECVDRTNAGFLGAKGWAGIKKAWAYGRYTIIQGDSDRFGNATCSGKFDGDHCIGVSPKHRLHPVNRRSQHWIDDGICPGGRWEYDSIIYSYAHKLAVRTGTPLRWGAFKGSVPQV